MITPIVDFIFCALMQSCIDQGDSGESVLFGENWDEMSNLFSIWLDENGIINWYRTDYPHNDQLPSATVFVNADLCIWFSLHKDVCPWAGFYISTTWGSTIKSYS